MPASFPIEGGVGSLAFSRWKTWGQMPLVEEHGHIQPPYAIGKEGKFGNLESKMAWWKKTIIASFLPKKVLNDA